MRVVLIGEAAAERDQFLEHLPSTSSVGAEIRIAIDEGSSLLRPIANSQHVERRVVLDDRVEHHVQDLRVDEVAFGFDDLAVLGHRRVRADFIASDEYRQRERRLHVVVGLARPRPARDRASIPGHSSSVVTNGSRSLRNCGSCNTPSMLMP